MIENYIDQIILIVFYRVEDEANFSEANRFYQ